MVIIPSKKLTENQEKQIDELWNKVYPVNLNSRFKLLLEGIKKYQHYLLLSEADEVIGWAVTFLREEENWFSIMISPAHQNKGYGSMLINRLKQDCNTLCGWVIDHNNDILDGGVQYLSPMAFYLKADFKISAERIETELISAVKIRFAREF